MQPWVQSCPIDTGKTSVVVGDGIMVGDGVKVGNEVMVGVKPNGVSVKI